MAAAAPATDHVVLSMITDSFQAPTGQARYSPARKTVSAEAMEKAARDQQPTIGDRLESERILAERYAKAPRLYQSDRKLSAASKVECQVRREAQWHGRAHGVARCTMTGSVCGTGGARSSAAKRGSVPRHALQHPPPDGAQTLARITP